jgi:hypothetical protein
MRFAPRSGNLADATFAKATPTEGNAAEQRNECRNPVAGEPSQGSAAQAVAPRKFAACEAPSRGVAAGRSAQRACERSSDWRRGAASSPDPDKRTTNKCRARERRHKKAKVDRYCLL